MSKKRVLCYGDSLTWGFDPDTRTRFGEDSRWPRVMGQILGDGYEIIEEGQNGRTIATDDPAEGEKNGLKYIGPCLESHTPLDTVIIMLGSNDCKRKFSYSAMDIAGEMQIMLEKIKQYNEFRCQSSFRIILVSPPVISDAIRDSWLGDSFGYENACRVSSELAGWYEQLSKMYDTGYINAAEHVKASDSDGCHMDSDNQRILGRVIAQYILDRS
ncbi:MAG: acylhydrolase [Clostridiales bacterium]|nr:acylhydrolase [Clostridiales bacterium]